jgi:hypothetical protein
MEQFTAVQALAASSTFHLGNPPSYPKHRRGVPSAPKSAAVEEDAEENADLEEKEIEKGGGRTWRTQCSACSVRPNAYNFSSALTSGVDGRTVTA